MDGGVQHAIVPTQPLANELSLDEHHSIFQLSHHHFQVFLLRIISQKQNYFFPIHFHFTKTLAFLKKIYQSFPFTSSFVKFLYSYCFKLFKELQITLELYLHSLSTEEIDISAMKQELLQTIPFEQRYTALWKLICKQQKIEYITWHNRLEQVFSSQLQFQQFSKPKIVKKESNELEKAMESWNKKALKQSIIDPTISYNQQLLKFLNSKFNKVKEQPVNEEQQQQQPILESSVNASTSMITWLQDKLNEIGVFNPLYQIQDENTNTISLQLSTVEDQILFDRMRQRVKWILEQNSISMEQKQLELNRYYAYLKNLNSE